MLAKASDLLGRMASTRTLVFESAGQYFVSSMIPPLFVVVYSQRVVPSRRIVRDRQVECRLSEEKCHHSSGVHVRNFSPDVLLRSGDGLGGRLWARGLGLIRPGPHCPASQHIHHGPASMTFADPSRLGFGPW